MNSIIRARSQRGAAAVEFALVAPIVAMLLIGTVTVALAYSQHVALSNAVREGARLGASMPQGSNWLSSVQQHTSDAYADADGLSNGSVCATLIKTTGGASPTYTTLIAPPSGCGTAPSNPSSVAAGCFVKVWATKQTHLNWILGNADPWMRATAVAIYDRSQPCS